MSCRSKQETVRTTALCDSMASVRTTVIRQGTALPPRQAKLDIPLKAAAELPERAVYTAKDGMVTVTLERKDSTLVIKAETDSIVPKLEMDFTDAYTLRKVEYDEESKPPDKVPWWKPWGYFIIPPAVAILLLTILQTIKKLLKKWLKRKDT